MSNPYPCNFFYKKNYDPKKKVGLKSMGNMFWQLLKKTFFETFSRFFFSKKNFFFWKNLKKISLKKNSPRINYFRFGIDWEQLFFLKKKLVQKIFRSRFFFQIENFFSLKKKVGQAIFSRFLDSYEWSKPTTHIPPEDFFSKFRISTILGTGRTSLN